MVTILAPLAFMIVGAFLHILASNGGAREIGRALFWAGAFALAFHLAAHPLRL